MFGLKQKIPQSFRHKEGPAGYDLEPLVTLESKRVLWERALEEDWLLVFEHDPRVPWGRLDRDAGRIQLREE